MKAKQEVSRDGRVFVEPADILFTQGVNIDGLLEIEHHHERFFEVQNPALMWPHDDHFFPSALFQWACMTRYGHEPN